jgi:hypothetical protein
MLARRLTGQLNGQSVCVMLPGQLAGCPKSWTSAIFPDHNPAELPKALIVTELPGHASAIAYKVSPLVVNRISCPVKADLSWLPDTSVQNQAKNLS